MTKKQKKGCLLILILKSNYGRAGEMAMAGAGDGMEGRWGVSCHTDELLRDERKRQKLTQQQLGERIGKKREYISSLEQGQTDMQLSTFMLIANALGLRFSIVVG